MSSVVSSRISANRTLSPRSCASSSQGAMLPSWSSFVTTISSPASSSRPAARESAKFSVVMFAPNATSSAPQPRNPAATRRASPTRRSLRTLVSNGPPRFAFDPRRYAAIASTTSSGACVPPGASKNASSRSSAENRFRIETGSIRSCAKGTLCWHRTGLAREGEDMEAAALPATDVAERAASAVVASRDVTRRYGEGDAAVDALRGVTLDVAEGKLTAVMGPSGSGKSTLMHILAALDMPTSGAVWIAGTKLGELSDTESTKIRREHIGFVFQFFNLLPMLTAEENVLLPLTIAGEKPDEAWREDLLKKVGLTDRRTHRPAELSGGQQQRVAIARALVSRPTVLFADEPTGNLDSQTSDDVLSLLRDSVDELGQTTVMVTHDPHAAARADRILFLADGQIVKDVRESTAAEVLAAMQEVSGR